MFRNHPLVARLLPRLLYQLVPAALVTTVGVLLLSNLAKVSDTPPVTAPVETAINAEAVFKIVPREPVEEAPAEAKPDAKRLAAARAAANPKPPVAGTATPASRKAANEACSPASGRGRGGSAADRANPRAAGCRGAGQREHRHGQAAQRLNGGAADSAMGDALGGGLVLGGCAAAPAAGTGAGTELPGGDVALNNSRHAAARTPAAG